MVGFTIYLIVNKGIADGLQGTGCQFVYKIKMNQTKITLRRGSSQRVSSNPQKVSSKQLLGETKKLFIQHAGGEYTLRITANNKLILTK